MSDFVPTPSVDETRIGSRMPRGSNAKSPPNPPMSPTTSGRSVDRTCSLMSSTARSPAPMSTPALAYVSGHHRLARCDRDTRLAVARSPPLTRHVQAAGVERHHVRCAHRVTVVDVGSSSRTSFESASADWSCGNRDRVLARQAGGAERVGRRTRSRDQAVEVEVGERVDADEVADLADRQVGGEQFRTAAGVETVETRPPVGRRRHPEVHLGRAGLAQHRDELAQRGAAHDRVLDDDETLPADVLRERVELEPYALLALLLVGLDERAPDVAVLHQTVAVRDARRTRVALRGGNAGLRHRHHHVGRDRRLAGQLLAHPLARGVRALAP